MEMSIGEIVDRLSILFYKVERIGDECLPEFYAYAKEVLLNTNPDSFEEVVLALRELYRINGLIWALESDIRKGQIGQMNLEEIGRRTLEIRKHNSQRVGLKNKISIELGHFQDIKIDHASAPGQEF